MRCAERRNIGIRGKLRMLSGVSSHSNEPESRLSDISSLVYCASSSNSSPTSISLKIGMSVQLFVVLGRDQNIKSNQGTRGVHGEPKKSNVKLWRELGLMVVDVTLAFFETHWLNGA